MEITIGDTVQDTTGRVGVIIDAHISGKMISVRPCGMRPWGIPYGIESWYLQDDGGWSRDFAPRTITVANQLGEHLSRASQKHVTIEVSGGVAEVTACSPGVQVRIIDHDNREGDA